MILEFDRKQTVILHLTWIAFFLTFLAWFNMAPFNTTLRATLGLTPEQIQILMICNVALTIPARIIIGSLVDRLGPKKVFVGLLLFAAAVFFLVLLSLFGALEFFKWIGAYALFVFITLYFLKPFGTPGGSNPQT